MKPTKIEITVHRFDYPVTVELLYTPAQEGTRYELFDRFAEPDDPFEIEILGIYCRDSASAEIEANRELNEAWLLEHYADEIEEAYQEKLAEHD